MLDWVIAHPNAATALATMSLVAVGLFIGGGQIAVIWVGIRAMDRSSAARKADRDAAQEDARKRFEADERRHEEAMKALAREEAASTHRHEEAMKALAREEADSAHRHREAMEALARQADDTAHRHEESMEALTRRHEESMAALKALIERTAPQPAPAG